MKINSAGESPGETTQELQKFLAFFSKDVVLALNGNLTFADNLRCQIIDVSFTAANTNKVISHSLKRVPSGYFTVRSSAGAILYDGTTVSDLKSITLKSTAIATMTLVIF